MGNPYTSQSISGYNTSPPSDDGATTEANRVNWSKHKTKLGDPIKTLSEAINTEVTTAFGKIALNNTNSQGGSYTVLAADQGKLIRVTGAGTITTPAASTVGVPFMFAVKNEHTAAITLDGSGSENIDGSATYSLPASQAVTLMTDGTNWFTAGKQIETGAAAGEVPTNDQAFEDVASATTTDIGAATSHNVRITGTTTIAGLGTVASGIRRKVRFADALTLTHNGTSLILPGAANITTAADDTAEFHSLGSGNWLCHSYKKADGTALVKSGMTALAEYNPSAAASVDVTSVITGSYTKYLFVFENILPATDGVSLQMRTSTDNSTFDSGASNYAYAGEGKGTTSTTNFGSAGATLIQLTGGGASSNIGNTSIGGVNGRIYLFAPASASAYTKIEGQFVYTNDAPGEIRRVDVAGMRISAGDVDAVQFFFSGGNIASGKIVVYGMNDP